MVSNSKLSRGVSMIEVVIGTAILLLAMTGLLTAYNVFVRAGTKTMQTVQASYLLEEGVEAVSTIRDKGWAANIASLSLATNYYLYWSSGRWNLTTTPSLIDNFYTRYIVFSSVYRDANDEVANSDDYNSSDDYIGFGDTLDPGTIRVRVYVKWQDSKTIKSRTIATYLTNLYNN